MIYNRDSMNKILDNTIECLIKSGIHNLYVKSQQEAKNFIMYHIAVGTIVFIEDCIEIKSLDIEQSIVEKGGTILTDASYIDYLNVQPKNSIIKVQLHGAKYILENRWGDNKKYPSENSIKQNRFKTIIVIPLEYCEEINKFICNLEMEKLNHNEKTNKSEKREDIYNDISIVIIG